MYALVRLTIGNKDSVEISPEEFDELVFSRAIISNYLSFESAFYSVCEAFKAMEVEYFTQSLNEMLYHQSTTADFHQIRANYNSIMLSSLAISRLYTYTIVSVALSILGGSLSREDIEEKIKIKSGDSFEYRVMKAIRNYSQHQAFPVHELSIGSEWVENKNLSSVDYLFRSDAVPNGDIFSKALIKEIGIMGGKVDLRNCFRGYFNALCEVHMEFRKLMSSKLDHANNIVIEMRHRWQQFIEDDSVVGVAACKLVNDTLCESSTPIYLKASGDDDLNYLKSRMISFTGMHHRSVKL